MAKNMLIAACGLLKPLLTFFYLDMNSGDDVKIFPFQNIICGRNSTLKIRNRIKSGRYGDLYSGLLTSKNPANGLVNTELTTVKIESREAELRLLAIECNFYSHLHQRSSNIIDGIPFLHRYISKVDLECSVNGIQRADSFSCLITELYGVELASIRMEYGHGLPFATFYDLAKQMFSIMNFLSIRRLLHRNITPSTFTVTRHVENDRRKVGKLLLVDFAMSKITEQRRNDELVKIKRIQDLDRSFLFHFHYILLC